MKLMPLFSAKAARRDLADTLNLSAVTHADLESNPDKFIDDNFGDECCGATRAMLGGGPSTIESFRHITPFELLLLGVMTAVTVGGACVAIH